MSVGWYALYVCNAPSINCATVKRRTHTAIQNVSHWIPLRLSYHSWEIVLGRVSSYSCFTATNRSCQHLNLSIWRSADLSRPHFIISLSRLRDREQSRNNAVMSESNWGKKRATVFNVSSTNPAGNSLLQESTNVS